MQPILNELNAKARAEGVTYTKKDLFMKTLKIPARKNIYRIDRIKGAGKQLY